MLIVMIFALIRYRLLVVRGSGLFPLIVQVGIASAARLIGSCALTRCRQDVVVGEGGCGHLGFGAERNEETTWCFTHEIRRTKSRLDDVRHRHFC